MANFKILNGIFAGRIVSSDGIFDISFDAMSIELQAEIYSFAELRGFPMESQEDEEFAIKAYEEDLEVENSDKKVNLFPLSRLL